MTLGQHAIVIGGSMAGLMAGRALADHFAQVTVVDRDTFPEQPEPRRGVPQGHHIHILLMRGRALLEQYFPGLDHDLEAAGAGLIDWGADVLWLNAAGWGPRFHAGLYARTCTRPLLEWHVQRRLAARPNVTFRPACEVTGLAAGENRLAVTGVHIRHRDSAQIEETLSADLVVDCSGRSSHAPDWLDALGYPRPEETVVNSFIGYAGRICRPPAGFRSDWKLLLIAPAPPENSRYGVIYPIEGGLWIASLSGAARSYPPTDEEGWLEFARGLRSPVFYDAVKNAEPLSPLRGYQRTENRRHYYERLARRPENFLVMGDAACAVNPVYGQGMTAAAMAGDMLAACLADQPRARPAGGTLGLAPAFQQRLARVNDVVWTLATGDDFRYPTTEGPRPGALLHFVQRYVDQVLLLAQADQNVDRALIEVFNLTRPPSALFSPGIMLRALPRMLGAATGRRRPESVPPAPRLAAGQDVP